MGPLLSSSEYNSSTSFSCRGSIRAGLLFLGVYSLPLLLDSTI